MTTPETTQKAIKKNWFILTVAVLLVIGLASWYFLSQKDQTATKIASIQITTDGFTPNVLRVSTGTTVTWTNNDEAPHQVTITEPSSTADKFGSSTLAPNQSYSYTFNQATTVYYHDQSSPQINGSVVVE